MLSCRAQSVCADRIASSRYAQGAWPHVATREARTTFAAPSPFVTISDAPPATPLSSSDALAYSLRARAGARSHNPFTGQLLLTNLIGDIYSIDPTTGAGTLITPTVTSNIGGGGLTALSFNAAGDLFGFTFRSEQLVKINLALGTSTAVSGALGFTDVRGLDFDRTATNAAVPEPTSLLLLGTGCAALVRRARRR